MIKKFRERRDRKILTKHMKGVMQKAPAGPTAPEGGQFSCQKIFIRGKNYDIKRI